MSSKRRLRRSACQGKRQFDTHEEALAAIESIRNNGQGGGLIPYSCSFCHKYHIGHPPAAVKNRINASKEQG
jgi:hypothetical protein